MARIALADNPWVRVSSWELEQADWSGARAVLDAHRAQLHDYCSGASVDRPEWLPPGR